MLINPKRPPYISKENWQQMSWKEKDYVELLRQRRWTNEQIKRILYITSDQGLWKLRKRVRKYINLVDGQTQS